MDSFYRSYLDAEMNRRGTNCEKWDNCANLFGRADVLPMWVADMDFPTVPAVVDALVERAKHPIYGYTENSAAEKQAEQAWLKRRYNLDVQEDWILYSPGVVDSIFFCVRALTQESDQILIQPPVYGPFFRAVKTFGRTLVESPLKQGENGWEMDFESLEARMAEGVKMMILCNPHNPVGRVWSRDELQRLMNIAAKHGVIVVSDEIHSDFTLEGVHTRILSLNNSDLSIMLTSATKSFNLAGLRQSSAIIRNPELREKVQAEIDRAHSGTPNIFGAIAQTAAYSHGDTWMDAVVEYVRENRDFAVDFIHKNMPEITCNPQQGSYLLWLNFSGLGISHEETFRKLVDEAGVGLNSGLDYGEQGRGFFRFNLATQRALVEQALQNIEKMVRSMRK